MVAHSDVRGATLGVRDVGAAAAATMRDLVAVDAAPPAAGRLAVLALSRALIGYLPEFHYSLPNKIPLAKIGNK